MKTSMQQYRRYFPLIIVVTLLSSIGLIFWFGILSFHRFITEKADGIQEYHASRENRERQIGRLPDLQHQFENILSHEETLDILLSESQIVDFVKTLENLAVETGTFIEIEAIDKDAIQEKKVVRPAKKSDTDTEGAVAKKGVASIIDSVPYDRYLHVNVVVIGEYQPIASFLHKVETLPLGLDVIGLSMRTRDVVEPEERPDNPGRNPFLILSQGTLPVDTAQSAASDSTLKQGSLEATFDTVIYVSK